jgi:hypothetical protein
MQTLRRYCFRTMIFSILLMTASCSGLSVMSDYDREYDFNRHRTYAWVTGVRADSGDVLAENQLVMNRIKAAVDRELAARGLILSGSAESDLVLSARAYVKEKNVVRYVSDPFYYGFAYRGRLYRYRPWSIPFYETPVFDSWREGRLIIDMIDERAKRLVWRGSARGPLREYRSSESLQKDIDLAVSKIFSDFPFPEADTR